MADSLPESLGFANRIIAFFILLNYSAVTATRTATTDHIGCNFCYIFSFLATDDNSHHCYRVAILEKIDSQMIQAAERIWNSSHSQNPRPDKIRYHVNVVQQKIIIKISK